MLLWRATGPTGKWNTTQQSANLRQFVGTTIKYWTWSWTWPWWSTVVWGGLYVSVKISPFPLSTYKRIQLDGHWQCRLHELIKAALNLAEEKNMQKSLYSVSCLWNYNGHDTWQHPRGGLCWTLGGFQHFSWCFWQYSFSFSHTRSVWWENYTLSWAFLWKSTLFWVLLVTHGNTLSMSAPPQGQHTLIRNHLIKL